MFQNAVRLYWNCLCAIGAEDKLHGTGCRLSANHILTAHHVVAENRGRIVALLHDGLYSCQLCFCDAPADIALLRIIERVANGECGLSMPTMYPAIATKHAFLGASIGFLTYLHKEDATLGGETQSHRFFSQGFVSFWRIKPEFRCVLTCGFIEGGFSGSPAFFADGSLAGVMVQSCSMGSTSHPDARFCLPMFSSLAKLQPKLIEAMQ